MISQHGEPDRGAPAGPRTDRDHLVEGNLGHYCLKIFETAKLGKESKVVPPGVEQHLCQSSHLWESLYRPPPPCCDIAQIVLNSEHTHSNYHLFNEVKVVSVLFHSETISVINIYL